MIMHVNSIQCTMLDEHIFVQISAHHPPMHFTSLCSDITKRTTQHSISTNPVSSFRNSTIRIRSIFLIWNQSNVFQGYIVHPIEVVKSMARLHGNISHTFLQSDPLIANDRSAAMNPKSVVAISFSSFRGRAFP